MRKVKTAHKTLGAWKKVEGKEGTESKEQHVKARTRYRWYGKGSSGGLL